MVYKFSISILDSDISFLNSINVCSILWSLERYDKVIIHGFDFFQTSKDHYFDTKIKKILIKYGIINMGNKHDNVAEQIFVNKLIAQNKVNTLQKYLQE